ncbi:MAG: transcription antiterminator, partial [Lachnospiraceae bacterium]|nr:transcription antiterminator [Lachnospiraceae bacterium]
MLNQRQVEILLEMMENAGTYMTASHFTGRHGVSLRTVQGDMKAIRAELDSFSCLEYDSAAPKGSRVRILDEEEAREVRNSLLRQYSDNPNGGQEERVRQILLLLLRQHRSMSMYDVEDRIYISRSTLTGDLRRVRQVLDIYGL